MSIYDWSTTASSNSTADSNIGWAEGQSPSTVNNSARAMMAALKSFQLDVSGLTLGGSGDAFALTPAQPLASLANAIVGFFATRTNAGAVTLAVSGLTAKPLRFDSGVDLVADQIVSGAFYQCAYNPATDEWLAASSEIGKAYVDAEIAAAVASAEAAMQALLPTGMIALWSGTVASIPTDWQLCDGTNGTPDLRNVFVIGAHSDDAGAAKTTVTGSPTVSGGSKDAIVVAHDHTATSTVTDPGHNHNIPITGSFAGATYPAGGRATPEPETNTSTATTGITVATTVASSGSSGTNANLPPYYALCYIMRIWPA